MINLPAVPKPGELADAIEELDDRVIALEQYVARNTTRIDALETHYNELLTAKENRITQLEADIAEHQAGAIERQQEVDQIRASNERLRWAITTGRKP